MSGEKQSICDNVSLVLYVKSWAFDGFANYTNYDIYHYPVENVLLLVKVEEVSPVIGIPHAIYIISNHRIAI